MAPTCDHCGRTAGGYATGTGGERLCHPDDPNRPDCYRRVTVYAEPLGSLKGIGQPPPGVMGLTEDKPLWAAAAQAAAEGRIGPPPRMPSVRPESTYELQGGA